MQIKSTVLAASLLIFLKIFKYKVENYLIKHIFQTIAPLPGCSYFGGGEASHVCITSCSNDLPTYFFCTSCELTFFDWSESSNPNQFHNFTDL